MNRSYIIILTCSTLCGCLGNSASSPKLELNVDSINFCGRPVDDTVLWNNLQLRNPSKGVLTISSISIRGDEGCAFSCEYPDPGGSGALISCPAEGSSSRAFALEGGRTLLVRIGYTPSSLGESDSAALIIESDASNLIEDGAKTAVTAIGMCGFGVDETPSADAGVSADGGLEGGDCPACADLPEKGAPSCAER